MSFSQRSLLVPAPVVRVSSPLLSVLVQLSVNLCHLCPPPAASHSGARVWCLLSSDIGPPLGFMAKLETSPFSCVSLAGYVGYVRLESTSSPSSVSPHHRLAPARSLGTVAFRRQLSSASCASGSARGAEKDEDTGSFLVRSVELLLICRRSSKRGGTRYNARGIDDEGNVSEAVCERPGRGGERD